MISRSCPCGLGKTRSTRSESIPKRAPLSVIGRRHCLQSNGWRCLARAEFSGLLSVCAREGAGVLISRQLEPWMLPFTPLVWDALLQRSSPPVAHARGAFRFAAAAARARDGEDGEMARSWRRVSEPQLLGFGWGFRARIDPRVYTRAWFGLTAPDQARELSRRAPPILPKCRIHPRMDAA